LPHKDGRQMYFMMAMDPPMKQGNTRYPFLIVLFNIDEQISVELTVSEKTKEKFGDRIEKLDKVIEGPYHEVVSRICRTVLDKKITVPGNFTTAAGAKCYPCSFKAQSGFLYPLERGFVFVNKPPLHILFVDISLVKFDRSSGGTKSFDFEIEHKNGTKYTFNGIEKAEQEKFSEFVKSKGISIAKSDKDKFDQSKFSTLDDDKYDPYAERMKDEGREKDGADAEDDDDDEEDEDFQGGSDSDDDLEYDSNASVDSASSGSDDAGGGNDESKTKEKKSSSGEKSKKSSHSSPKKRTSKEGGSKDKSKKSKSSSEQNTSRNTDGKSAPKSAEFVEDKDTDSD